MRATFAISVGVIFFSTSADLVVQGNTDVFSLFSGEADVPSPAQQHPTSTKQTMSMKQGSKGGLITAKKMKESMKDSHHPKAMKLRKPMSVMTSKKSTMAPRSKGYSTNSTSPEGEGGFITKGKRKDNDKAPSTRSQSMMMMGGGKK